MATQMTSRTVARAPRRHTAPRQSPSLDSYDISILSALLTKPRASAAELAGVVHLSRTAVTRRIATLIDTGVLDKLHASMSYEDVGLGVRASIELLAPTQPMDEICRRLLVRPEVLEVTVMSGGTTLVVDVVATDVPHLRHFICSIDDLSDTATRIVFSKMRSPLTLRERLRLMQEERATL